MVHLYKKILAILACMAMLFQLWGTALVFAEDTNTDSTSVDVEDILDALDEMDDEEDEEEEEMEEETTDPKPVCPRLALVKSELEEYKKKEAREPSEKLRLTYRERIKMLEKCLQHAEEDEKEGVEKRLDTVKEKAEEKREMMKENEEMKPRPKPMMMSGDCPECGDLKQKMMEFEKSLKSMEADLTVSERDTEAVRAQYEDLKKQYEDCAEKRKMSSCGQEVEIPRLSGKCPDCMIFNKELSKYQDKLARLASGDTETDEMKRLKGAVEKIKERLEKCREMRDAGKCPKVSDVYDEAKEKCKGCEELKRMAKEKRSKLNEVWGNVKMLEAKIRGAEANVFEAGELEQLKDMLMKTQAQLKSLKATYTEVDEKLKTCMRGMQKSCPSKAPMVRSTFKKHMKKKAVKNRSKSSLFLQWGQLDREASEDQKVDWEGAVKMSGGKAMLSKKALFESRDSAEDSDGAVMINAHTTTHWDGVVVEFEPESDDAEVFVNLGEFSGTYSLEELYELMEEHNLDNGAQVKLSNPGRRVVNLDNDKYEDVVDRKKKVMEKLNRIDERIGEMVKAGEISDELLEKWNQIRDRIMNYNFSEGGVGKINQVLDRVIERIKKEVKKDDLDEVDAEFGKVKRDHVKDKYKEGLIPFCDTDDDDWFVDHVKFLKENNIASGTPGDCVFKPGNNVTRAELMKMVMEAAGHDTSDEVSELDVPDVEGHWGKKYIKNAMKRGIVKGYKDGFRPNQQVTRAEAMKMILNALGIPAPEGAEGGDFDDTKGHWAEAIIKHGKDNGIVSGMADGKFKPNQPITRAAVAKIIRNAVKYARDLDPDAEDAELKQIEEDAEKDLSDILE